MTAFTRTFGGQVVNPTSVSYATYSVVSNLVLQWPFQDPVSGNVLAWQNDITTGLANLTVTFPDATLVSVGSSALINNTGAQSFTILANDGLTVIGTVASGQQWYFYLVGNSNNAGQWRGVQFGTGTSSASAASLAGAGLVAAVTKLNQNLVIQPKVGNYSPLVSDLATVLQSLGGTVVWTPGSASTFGNGWFVYVINDGTGTLTWTPSGGQLIDNAATKVFQPTESAVIFSDGANFWSLGYGRSISSTVTAVNIPVTSTAFTLTGSQAAAQVQDYSGVLSGPTVVQYGTGPGFWFVRNNTTGAFTLTLEVNGADTGVVIPQGSFSIIRSNGSNMSVAFTATSGTVTSVATTSNLTGGPITTTGTLDLSSTGVTAAVYGSAAAVPVLMIDVKGRIVNATTAPLGTSAAINKSAAAGLPDANLMLQLDTNGLVPSVNGGFQTGDVVMSLATAKAGFVFASGQSIGSPTSGATQRANADTQNLYTLLWNNCSNTVCPVVGGRGATAAADFAANKALSVPDMRGTVAAGMDVINGSTNAGRLSAALSSSSMGASNSNAGLNTATTTINSGGANSINFGNVGFNQTSGQITSNSLGIGSPGAIIFASQAGDSVSVGGFTAVNGSFGINVSGTGTSSSFNIVQSTMVMNAFIKL